MDNHYSFYFTSIVLILVSFLVEDLFTVIILIFMAFIYLSFYYIMGREYLKLNNLKFKLERLKREELIGKLDKIIKLLEKRK